MNSPITRPPLLMLALLACTSTPSPKPADPESIEILWLLGPTPEQDLVHSETTEDSLFAKFGTEQVRHDSIYVGEGEYQPGTVMYADDSTRRVEILWADTLRRSDAAYIRVSNQASRWKVYPGVGIGTTLIAVDSLNGGPFELAGFSWDYGGTTYSFLGGRLDSLWRNKGLGHDLLLRFEPTMAGYDTLKPRLDGEESHRSDEPNMMLAKPRVREIVLRFTRRRG